MLRKKNKAYGVVFKALGTLVLLLAFVLQSFVFARWEDLGKGTAAIGIAGYRAATEWYDAYASWISSASPPDSQHRLQDAARLLHANQRLDCTQFPDECEDISLFSREHIGKLVADGRASPEAIDAVLLEVESHQKLLERIGKLTDDSMTWRSRIRSAFTGAYLIGMFLLLVGLFFEWRGVDE